VNTKKYYTLEKSTFFLVITLCIFLAFPLNMANALEEKADALEEKADALEEKADALEKKVDVLEEPLDVLEELTEDIQEIEKIDEEDEVTDSSVPEQENITITELLEENPEYHRGDVEAINKMIENGSIKDLEHNNPESWSRGGIRFHPQDPEKGEGRRIQEISIGATRSARIAGSIDVSELEYLEVFYISDWTYGDPVHSVTEINISGLKRLLLVDFSYCRELTVVDASDTIILFSFRLMHLPNMTTLNIEDSAIASNMSISNCPNLKQFTNTKGNTLIIESNGPGEVVFESYYHTSGEFTLEASPEWVQGVFLTGFSHWTATPNGVNFVQQTNHLSRTVTFTMLDDADTIMTAWFQPEPIISAPVIDKDSITITGASFSGTAQLFYHGFLDIGFEYRKKGEEAWSFVQAGVMIIDPNFADPLAEHRYEGNFSGKIPPFVNIPPTVLQPATTYEIRVTMTNGIYMKGYSDIVEFTTLCIVTIRHVESKNDGGYSVIEPEEADKIMHVHFGSGIDINAGEYLGLTGIHYRLMKNDDSGDIEDTIYALGTNLEIVDNTTIIVYHASTVVDVTFPTKMEFYAHYSDGGSVESKEEYSFVNNSALPVIVNLKRYDVIEGDGINFVANAVNDGDMHLSLLPTTINNNGFTTAITNMQPNTPLNRSLGTLGGYALGGNSVGGFTIGGEYVGVFYVQPRRPTLQFVFSFEIDLGELK
jgi:hypothetical protein